MTRSRETVGESLVQRAPPATAGPSLDAIHVCACNRAASRGSIPKPRSPATHEEESPISTKQP